MPHLKETEYWVYANSDDSLVGVLIVTDLEDDFMDLGLSLSSGKLIHARTDEIERMHNGEYLLKHSGKEEHFGDFDLHDKVLAAVKNHPDGPYYLQTLPTIPAVD